MATFVLVPGAWHPAWCWHKTVPLLEAGGHKVIPIDLPGTGENRDIHARDATLAIWAAYVANVVRKAEPPVLLAGHSRGGFIISEAAECVGEALAGLIYISAILPQPGQTLNQAAGFEPTDYLLDENGCVPSFSPDVASKCFYNRCSAEDALEATSRLFAEPLAPTQTPSGVTVERWGRVPRAYIECSDDNAVPFEVQRRMQAAAPCDPVMRLDSDHSPFFSAPQALADAMLEIADRFIPVKATA